MRQIPLVAALTAAAVLAVTATAVAAEAPQRYRTAAVSTRTDEVRVTRSGATWFRGVDGAGRPITVVFQPRFATVLRERDGKRVPVSYLRAGDQVAVTGRGTAGRVLAASAVQPTAPGAALPLAREAGIAACCTTACSDACRTCCAAGACASTKECCTTACSDACRTCCAAAEPAARAAASCCDAAPSATASSARPGCCGSPAGAATAKPAGCCG